MRPYPEFHSVEPNGTRARQDPLGTPLMAMPNRHRGHGNGRWRPNRADAVEQG